MVNLSPDKIKKIVSQYSDRIKNNYIFFVPNIPEKKLRNALCTYAPIEEGEQPLLLIDDTILGGAKRGVLLSDRKLYICQLFEKPRVINLDNIKSVKFVIKKSSRIVYINEKDFYYPIITDVLAIEQFCQVLRDIITHEGPSILTGQPVDTVKKSTQHLEETIDGDILKKPFGLSDKTPKPGLKSQPHMSQDWKTVRVFISSTFRDMQSERDYLVKVVFPELRERMRQRHLHLVDIDLRWGITEAEAEHDKVLEICLDEIERSRPFFVGILAERYGSVLGTLPEDAVFTHPWLAEYVGHSITALEIVHGVIRKPDLARRSFFYFRDPQLISQIPESKRHDFSAENAGSKRKIAALKDAIRLSGRPVMESYPARWDAVEGHVVEFEPFGQRVLEDLWTAICTEYPEEAAEADPLTVERELHEAFIEERARLHIGRVEQAARLTEYVQNTDRRPVVITGESGCGKSAFLASWYRKYATAHLDDFVLAYFISASPTSTNHLRLLRNMCEELKRAFSLKEEIHEDDKKLSESLAMLLHTALQTRPRIVVVVDALDQLFPLEGAHGLGWLLDYMPEKVCLVMSTREGDCLDVLRRREAEEIMLPPLSQDEQRQVVQALLGEWRRKLDDQQMAALLEHSSASNPLYLRVALEELRLFGRFEQLTEHIKVLSSDIVGLFDQVLARLEEDHGREFVTEAFALIGCSRYGLSEAELMDLLRREGEAQLPRALWSRLARSAIVYLVQRGELVGFFHRELADAVAVRYLSKEKKHVKLAVYFAQAPTDRKLDEYPYQLQQAEDWQDLAATLSDLDFFEYAWDHDRKFEWMGYWRSLQGRFESDECYKKAMLSKKYTVSKRVTPSRLLYKLGRFHYDMGLFEPALSFHQSALVSKKLSPENNDVYVAANLESIGEIYRWTGKWMYALSYYRRALKLYKKVLGDDAPQVAACLIKLSETMQADPDRLAMCSRARSIYERAFGPDHLTVATSLMAMTWAYQLRADFAQAVTCCEHALAIRERVLGPTHPDTAESLMWLAEEYLILGNRNQVFLESLARRARTVYERVLGQDHPETAESLRILGDILLSHGNFEEAQTLLERSSEIFERANSHPSSLLWVQKELLKIYKKQGKQEEVRSLKSRMKRVKGRETESSFFLFYFVSRPGSLLFLSALNVVSIAYAYYNYNGTWTNILYFSIPVVFGMMTRFFIIIRSESVPWAGVLRDFLLPLAIACFSLNRLSNPTLFQYLFMMTVFFGGIAVWYWELRVWFAFSAFLFSIALLNMWPLGIWTIYGIIQVLLAFCIIFYVTKKIKRN